MATEKRLIDANALMKSIRNFRWVGVPNTLQLMFSYLRIIIRDQPTVDAVEVVRCKDCKDHDRCEVEDLLVKFLCIENAYCAAGERKDNGKIQRSNRDEI
jgi:hypothetical protein